MKFGEDNEKCHTVVRLKPRKHGGGATNEEDGGASYTATTNQWKEAQSNPLVSQVGDSEFELACRRQGPILASDSELTMSFSAKLLKAVAPDSSLLSNKGTLYETLSRLPQDGIGARVRQKRWDVMGRKDTYWEVTRVTIKNEGKNGKAWGRMVYKGTVVVAFRPASSNIYSNLTFQNFQGGW